MPVTSDTYTFTCICMDFLYQISLVKHNIYVPEGFSEERRKYV